MSCPVTVRSVLAGVLRSSNNVLRPSAAAPPMKRAIHTSAPVAQLSGGLQQFLSSRAKPAAAGSTAGASGTGLDHLSDFDNIFNTGFGTSDPFRDEYHLHIFSTRHNTHITMTDPKKQPIISVSAGNIGFRHSQRGSYDAAYQLAAYVFTQLEAKHIRPKNLEVILRGFGEGRDAAVKALLGTEGRHIKGAIKRVTDSTRLKFGGTRSKKPRRLG